MTADGRLLKQEEAVEFKLRLTKTQVEAPDRAREVLSARGHVPTLPEIFEKALADLLTKRDPLHKAQRHQAASARKDGGHQYRGGTDTAANLALRCRSHHQARARGELGEGYHVSWAESRGVGDEGPHP